MLEFHATPCCCIQLQTKKTATKEIYFSLYCNAVYSW